MKGRHRGLSLTEGQTQVILSSCPLLWSHGQYYLLLATMYGSPHRVLPTRKAHPSFLSDFNWSFIIIFGMIDWFFTHGLNSLSNPCPFLEIWMPSGSRGSPWVILLAQIIWCGLRGPSGITKALITGPSKDVGQSFLWVCKAKFLTTQWPFSLYIVSWTNEDDTSNDNCLEGPFLISEVLSNDSE